jgi:hypothetical protein
MAIGLNGVLLATMSATLRGAYGRPGTAEQRAMRTQLASRLLNA